MKKNNSEISNNEIKKQLLSMSVVKKNTKVDTEKILFDYLYPKFGERFLNYRKKYENYLKDNKHEYLPDYPISVILELVNRCNLECGFCYQGYRNDTTKSTLGIEDLENIFENFKKNKLDALLLSTSEPLLFKNYDKVLEMASKANIMDQFLFTNGTLLNEKNSNIILNSSLTRLFISIDAATESTYDKVRIPVNKKLLNTDRLSKIEENVKNFVKLRNSKRKKIPLVRVSFVAVDKNIHEMNEFVEKWVDIVDSVEIQKENSIEFYDYLNKEDNNRKQLLKSYNCNEPWGQVTIHSDGAVGPCCNTVGRNLPIGNVLEKDLDIIWKSEKMNEIRNGFLNNQPNKICQLCLENEKNNVK